MSVPKVLVADPISERGITELREGGLLVSVAGNDAAKMATELRDAGLQAAEIGEVVENGKPLIRVE